MDECGRVLRGLSLNDEATVQAVVTAGLAHGPDTCDLAPKSAALVGLGALVAAGGSGSSFLSAVDRAMAAGASRRELVAVLVVVAPVAGSARLVSGAAALAPALGYDLEGDFERPPNGW